MLPYQTKPTHCNKDKSFKPTEAKRIFLFGNYRLASRKRRHVMNDTNHAEEPETQPASELQKELDAEKARNQDYLNRLKYLQADIENLRNRCDRQVAEVSQYSNERIVIQLLEVVDELELAVKTAQATNSAQALTEGVQMTLKRLRKVLEQEGVKEIESINKPFDPSKHNAIAAEERDDVENCVVIEEIRKGYLMKQKVIRPSIVKVAVKKSQSQQDKEKKTDESN
jgi:molecular chaperone GrpE